MFLCGAEQNKASEIKTGVQTRRRVQAIPPRILSTDYRYSMIVV